MCSSDLEDFYHNLKNPDDMMPVMFGMNSRLVKEDGKVQEKVWRSGGLYEAAIGMVNSKTTAVRVIPAIGRKAGEVLDFGGLLGYGPIMAVNQHDPSVFINRGGRLPAPMQSLKN